MIAHMNQTGNLTRDPELKYTPKGTELCQFSVATNTRFGDKESVAFLEWKAWGKTAVFVSEHFRKGDPIQVMGRAETERWQDNEGKERSKLVFIAAEVGFIGGKRERAETAKEAPSQPAKRPAQAPARQAPDVIDDGSDVPF
jgi:single-strand DNA-binding protein